MGVCESRLDLPCCENRTEAGKLFPGDLYSLPRHIPEFRTRAYENHRPLPPQPSPRDSDLITLSTANGLVRVPEGSPEAQAIHWMQSPREKRGHIMEQGILSEHSHPLLLAARDGDLSILAQVLANGVSPNECDQYGRTALHFAAWEGHLEICKALVKAGAAVQATTLDGRTASACAAEADQADAVHYLLLLERGVSELELFYMKKAWGVTDRQRAPGARRATLQLYNKLEARGSKPAVTGPGSAPVPVAGKRRRNCGPTIVRSITALKSRDSPRGAQRS